MSRGGFNNSFGRGGGFRGGRGGGMITSPVLLNSC